MALQRIDGPAVEPVDLDEAKQHLRLDTNDDDVLVDGLIVAARLHVEQLLGRSLVSQTWIETFDAWPRDGKAVRLSLSPVRTIVEVRTLDADGTPHIVTPESYVVDPVDEPARICASRPVALPRPQRLLAGIEIEFVAGYGDAADAVPSPLRQAILLLVAHWYEHREPVSVGAAVSHIPQTVAGLIAPYRTRRIV